MRIPFDGLKAIEACGEAIAWLRSLPTWTTWQQAWDRCERGDWMLWLVWRQAWEYGFGSAEHRRVVACLVEGTISFAQPLWRDEDRATLQAAVDLAERYARGDAVTQAELSAAYAASSAASYAAYAASYAASYEASAASAAYAASAASYAAYAASYAACAASYAACAAYEASAAYADVVRAHFPEAPVVSAARMARVRT